MNFVLCVTDPLSDSFLHRNYPPYKERSFGVNIGQHLSFSCRVAYIIVTWNKNQETRFLQPAHAQQASYPTVQ